MPETAVEATARSIVSRMKQRLSIARSYSAIGSAFLSEAVSPARMGHMVISFQILSSTLQYKARYTITRWAQSIARHDARRISLKRKRQFAAANDKPPFSLKERISS
jgi:hypothetical protein